MEADGSLWIGLGIDGYLGQYRGKSNILFRFLLDVVTWTGIIAKIDDSGKPIETISDRDIKRLSENTVPLSGVGNDLGIAA